MRRQKELMLLILAIFALSFQSCSEDEALVEEPIVENFELANTTADDHGLSARDRKERNQVSAVKNDVLTEWTDLFLELERYATGMRPNASARAIAYIYLAAYETAVPGMKDFQSNEQRLDGLDIDGRLLPRHVNWNLALNACFADVMDHFVINITSDLNDQIAAKETDLLAEYSDNQRQNIIKESQEWGSYIAAQVIAYAQTDVSAEAQILDPQPRSYEPPTGDGFWTYSDDPERALFPYWGDVRTFVIPPEETTTVAPIDYSEDPSSPYFQQMVEVYNENNDARDQDGEQLWIAEFWSDDAEGITFSPPARQISIANQLIDQYRMNLERSLDLFVKLGFSLNDAAVSTWKYKYDYMVMRPNVFIHEFIDPDYQTNLFRLVYWPNPSFPGYPSGHSCFASAAGGIFIDFFGNRTDFTDYSHDGRDEFKGDARTFRSFRRMAEENAYSRIPLGVHIKMDCDEGIRLGYEIADAVNDLKLSRKKPL